MSRCVHLPTGFVPQHRSRPSYFGNVILRAKAQRGRSSNQSNGFSKTSIDLSLVYTKLSKTMADACSSCSSRQQSDSNESFGFSSSDGLWSSSSDSSEDDSRTGRVKRATLSGKRAWNQRSESAKGRAKTL